MCGVLNKKMNKRPDGVGGSAFMRLGIFRRQAMTCISNVFVVEFVEYSVLPFANGWK